jgi:SHS family lactate transporter-like MFS transporter
MSSASDHKAAVTAGFLGWTLDAFDFFLVVMTLTAIGREFHKTDAEMAVTLSVTLAFRPVGAFLFGLLADRYGRRLPLMLDLVFFSIVEVLSGLAPSYTSFIILRALFGIGMGAEWGVGASLVMEKVPVRLRGVFSGFLQQGYAMGYLLAAVAYWLVFPRWGWRPLFFIGGLPALLALYVRSHVKESEVWERTKHADWGQLVRAIAVNWKTFLFIVLLSTVMIFCSHGTQDMYPTYLQRQWGFTPGQRAGLTALSMVGALIGGVAAGALSDRIGRRKAIAISLGIGVLVVPLWAFAPSIPLLVVGAFLIQACVQGGWGVIPAHLNELSPDGVRGFLPGFGYQVGVLLGGTIVTMQAIAKEHFPFGTVMAASAAIVFTLAASVALLGPERKGVLYAGGR